jgi:hypothetical protein
MAAQKTPEEYYLRLRTSLESIPRIVDHAMAIVKGISETRQDLGSSQKRATPLSRPPTGHFEYSDVK